MLATGMESFQASSRSPQVYFLMATKSTLRVKISENRNFLWKRGGGEMLQYWLFLGILYTAMQSGTLIVCLPLRTEHLAQCLAIIKYLLTKGTNE